MIIMQTLKLLAVNQLIPHEKVESRKLEKVLADLKKTQILRKPVVIDVKSNIILDGHHRCQAFKEMGIREIPCLMVDYFSKDIKVYFRRPEIKNRLVKELILKYAEEGKLFPYKTTKHKLPNRPDVNMVIKQTVLKKHYSDRI